MKSLIEASERFFGFFGRLPIGQGCRGDPTLLHRKIGLPKKNPRPAFFSFLPRGFLIFLPLIHCGAGFGRIRRE
jgi:hypothetical protein